MFEAEAVGYTDIARSVFCEALLGVVESREWIDSRSLPWGCLLLLRMDVDKISALTAS